MIQSLTILLSAITAVNGFNSTGPSIVDALNQRQAIMAWTDTVLAPVVNKNETTASDKFSDTKSLIASTKVNRLNLGPITGDSRANPTWNGKDPILSPEYVDLISYTRSTGGDVVVSFSQKGSDLASFCSDSKELQKQYQLVIDFLSLSFINVELPASNASSLALHLAALSDLKDETPSLKLAITLSTSSVSGVDDDGLSILSAIQASALKDKVDIVNLNAFNFASAPNGQTAMGSYVISSVEGLKSSLDTLGYSKTQKLGVTVMIGQNDVQSELFSKEDAKQLVKWVKKTPLVSFLSYFSFDTDPVGQYAAEFVGWAGTLSYHEPVNVIQSPVILSKAVAITTVSTTGSCGAAFGICPGSACCSRYGYCGIGFSWCDSGCQPLYGKCTATAPPKAAWAVCSPTTDTCVTGYTCCIGPLDVSTSKFTCRASNALGQSHGCAAPTASRTTTSTRPAVPPSSSVAAVRSSSAAAPKPSTVGMGGKCGPADGSCVAPLCCSQHGWCGQGDAWCGAGCQRLYGTCGVSAPPAPAAPVTTTSRPAAAAATTVTPPNPVITGPSSAMLRIFAPYVDVLLWPTLDVTAIAKATGQKYFTLAFIVADGTGQPSWGGSVPLSQQWYMSYITSLRAMGGDVIISFGGATGQELATVAKDVATLQGQIQQVINMYKPKRIDFDVEGAALANTAANILRAKALVAIKAANPGIIITYTLPVTPTGLDGYGVGFLNAVASNGGVVDVLNIMAMDYGGTLLNDMGQTAITAAQGTIQQLRAAGLTSCSVAVTPMIGQNDVKAEVFTVKDAQTLLTFTKSNQWITGVSFWSSNRDVNNPTGPLYASSQIVQTNNQFGSIFAQFV